MTKIEVDVTAVADQLTVLLTQATDGHEVIVTQAGKPVAWLTPIPTPCGKRVLGFARGSVSYIAPDFDAPMPEEFFTGEAK